MAKRHAPSLMRQIRRELKKGASPESIFLKVKAIEDPYYRSLSFFLLMPYFSPKDKRCKESISLSNKDIEKVQQPWRRVELIGSISKIIKSVSDIRLQRQLFSLILEKIRIEKSKEIKDFLLKYTKNFPESYLSQLLNLSKNSKGNEFETGKAVIRHSVNIKSNFQMIDSLLEFDYHSRVKLLGYLHLQQFKSDKKIDSKALLTALDNAKTQESFSYLVRVCSKESDFYLLKEKIDILPAEDKLYLLISLISRADRKNFKDLAKEFSSFAETEYSSIPESEVKIKIRSKLDIALGRLAGNLDSKIVENIKPLKEVRDEGKHTLALYNTYGGNWNHPHFKSIFKASNLCAAFDLNLALVHFPEISFENLVKEIKKEMRLPNGGYIELLIEKKRVQFFKNKINVQWAGTIIATTESPDYSKLSLPDGRLCMVMGLGPKGLPVLFVKNSRYHFELTTKKIGFETGTAMGAISAHLHSLKY